MINNFIQQLQELLKSNNANLLDENQLDIIKNKLDLNLFIIDENIKQESIVEKLRGTFYHRKIVLEKVDKREITEKIKTFEDVCHVSGIGPKSFEPILRFKGFDESAIAREKLKLIAEALNEGWKPNWKDENEQKFYPWFEYKDRVGGFVFSSANYAYANAFTSLGSRLYFRTRKLAEYAGRTFLNEYIQMIK